jgi:hypothetical protein
LHGQQHARSLFHGHYRSISWTVICVKFACTMSTHDWASLLQDEISYRSCIILYHTDLVSHYCLANHCSTDEVIILLQSFAAFALNVCRRDILAIAQSAGLGEKVLEITCCGRQSPLLQGNMHELLALPPFTLVPSASLLWRLSSLLLTCWAYCKVLEAPCYLMLINTDLFIHLCLEHTGLCLLQPLANLEMGL